VTGVRGVSPLSTPEGRSLLLRKLRGAGYYVRMHAYEYLLADDDGFFAIILLEPSAGRAILVLLRASNIKRVVEILKKLDPELSLEIVNPPL